MLELIGLEDVLLYVQCQNFQKKFNNLCCQLVHILCYTKMMFHYIAFRKSQHIMP